MRPHDERGSMLVGFGLSVVLVFFVLGIGIVGGAAVTYATAASAADAAALASAPVTFLPFGATGTPQQEASRFAKANGATLVSCSCPVDESWDRRTVSVTVARTISLPVVGELRIVATSRAEFDPMKLVGTSGDIARMDDP
ncbi:MAG: hypothetical protein M5U23_02455 [Acidimicrobiia bacterium]|nr:hypothetical protein [Acidimicrobiia bacterium]